MSSLEARAFTRRGNTLVPSDIHADEFLAGIPDGKEVLALIKRPRSVVHHRRFFSLLSKVCANTENWHDVDELLDALKIAVGHVKRQMRLDGSWIIVPRSIDFASMGEDEFKRFEKRCLYVIHKEFGIDTDALMAEVDDEQKPRFPESQVETSKKPETKPAPSGVTQPPKLPSDGAGELFESEAVPPRAATVAAAGVSPDIPQDDQSAPAAVLTKDAKTLLRKYAKGLADARHEKTLARGSAAFLEDHKIEDGTPTYEAARTIYAAHLARVQAKSSPAEAESIVDRVLAS